jgi:hypothetical protein
MEKKVSKQWCTPKMTHRKVTHFENGKVSKKCCVLPMAQRKPTHFENVKVSKQWCAPKMLTPVENRKHNINEHKMTKNQPTLFDTEKYPSNTGTGTAHLKTAQRKLKMESIPAMLRTCLKIESITAMLQPQNDNKKTESL